MSIRDTSLVINLGPGAYLLLEPVPKTNDIQSYNATLKIYNLLQITGQAVYVCCYEAEFKDKLIFGIEDMIDSLTHLKRQILKDEIDIKEYKKIKEDKL